MVLPYPPSGFSVSSGVSSVTSPSYTSLVSLMRRPMARRKFSINTSVFLISEEYTSLPTMGQKGTLGPSSCEMASAMAGLPGPGPACKEDGATSHFFRLDYVDNDTA